MDGPTTLWSKAQDAALCDVRQRETRPKSVASGPDALVANKVPQRGARQYREVRRAPSEDTTKQAGRVAAQRRWRRRKMAAVSISGVRKNFGSTQVIRGVDIEI